MPSSGLSLIGFETSMPHALRHLRDTCIPQDATDTALLAEWKLAKSRLGAPFPNAGLPNIRTIPSDYDSYLSRVAAAPWLAARLSQQWTTATFKLIEIDPLLSIQHTIEVDRSRQIFAATNPPPALDELLGLCLPTAPKAGQVQYICQQNSILIRSKYLDLSSFSQGVSENFAGVRFGFTPSIVQVVRHKGHCYLHNGFHRAYGARLAGASEIPCLFRDVHDDQDVGMKPDGATFGAAVMESPHCPTLGHYTQGRAHPVRLRALSRVIHVSWSEYTVPEE